MLASTPSPVPCQVAGLGGSGCRCFQSPTAALATRGGGMQTPFLRVLLVVSILAKAVFSFLCFPPFVVRLCYPRRFSIFAGKMISNKCPHHEPFFLWDEIFVFFYILKKSLFILLREFEILFCNLQPSFLLNSLPSYPNICNHLWSPRVQYCFHLNGAQGIFLGDKLPFILIQPAEGSHHTRCAKGIGAPTVWRCQK